MAQAQKTQAQKIRQLKAQLRVLTADNEKLHVAYLDAKDKKRRVGGALEDQLRGTIGVLTDRNKYLHDREADNRLEVAELKRVIEDKRVAYHDLSTAIHVIAKVSHVDMP